MVTTPVPPTPVIRIFQGRSSVVRLGGSGSASSSVLASRRLPLRGAPPCTVTKLGQKPETQE